MKFLLLLSIVALSWAQEDMNCLCGMFASYDLGEVEVHTLPPKHIQSCHATGECKSFCTAEWEYIFDNGGLHFSLDNSTMSIGDECCENLAQVYGLDEFPPTELYGYYKVCDDPWRYEGEASMENICCVGGQYPEGEDPCKI